MLPALSLDILLNNPWNQPDCNIAFVINFSYHKADLLFFAGNSVSVVAVGHGIDNDFEMYKEDTLLTSVMMLEYL